MHDTPLIDVQSATHRFGPHAGIEDVSLTVDRGEIVGLLGANGAGKTTLIRMILGLTAVQRGTIQVFGAPPSRSIRTRLGYMPQGLGLYTDLTVAQNHAFVAAAFDTRNPPPLPGELQPIANRLVGEIGLGRQRLLAFATTLLHTPDLLVLDEPTSGVDPLARARLWDTIHEQRERGAGVLVTTHYLEEAEQCSRLVIMSGGRLVAMGTKDEITGRSHAVVVESPNWSATFTALTAAGLPVTLAGRAVRVAGTAVDVVEAALAAAGLETTCHAVPATLEETMVLIERNREPGA